MLAEVNCLEAFDACKRQRTFSHEEINESYCVPRKKQPKTHSEDQNPYETIPELPHVKLTEEDMKGDPIQLFLRLQQKYSQFGAVRVSACEKWKCPFQERFVDKGITTRIQHLAKLKHGKAFEQNVEAYTFQSYQAYAVNLERTYKFKTQPTGATIESKKQSEYWSLVTKPQYEKCNVKVEYAADLPSTKYGSGFPLHFNLKGNDQNFSYDSNLFNLNNTMNSPSSLLSMAAERKEKVSGITHPWVYMGAMFSSFCWHVEDLWVNSLNYNHKGGIKTWYVVPASHKDKFDQYIKNKYCLSSHKQTLLDRITFMVDPLQLIKAGISVYKTYQKPREYICTFFRAYHCGFSQGYNIGEAVNFLSPLSIKHMRDADKAKKKNLKRNPNVIPIDWIIYENYLRVERLSIYGQRVVEAYEKTLDEEKMQLQDIKAKSCVVKIITYPETRRYDKFYCSECKQYLYLRSYMSDNGKVYCAEHLKKDKENKVTLFIRSPNQDRKYILELFNKIPIQVQADCQQRRKSDKRALSLVSKLTNETQ